MGAAPTHGEAAVGDDAPLAGEERCRDLRQPSLCRRLLGASLLAERDERQDRLAGERAAALRQHRQLLRDAGARLRAGLRRRDRRQGVFVRRIERQAALVAIDGGLCLLLCRRLALAHLRRLVLPHLLLSRRGDRRRPVEVQGQRPDLRVADDRGGAGLLRDAGGEDLRARREERSALLDVPGRQVLAGRRRCEAPLPGRLRASLRARRTAGEDAAHAEHDLGTTRVAEGGPAQRAGRRDEAARRSGSASCRQADESSSSTSVTSRCAAGR